MYPNIAHLVSNYYAKVQKYISHAKVTDTES